MKIIITGATGSLGASLTRYFSQKGHEIIASGQMKVPPQELLKYASYIQADIRNKIALPDADVCIHTAALSDDKAALKDLLPANSGGTQNVIEATKNCTTFIHISSSSVYTPSNNLITEEMAGENAEFELSAYGKSKLESEKTLLKTIHNQRCFILRPRALYGIGDKMILPRMFKLVKNGKLFCPGSMQVGVSMTHYKNIAHAIECCLNSNKTGIHTYNVSDLESYQLIDVLRKLTREIYGSELPEKKIPVWVLKAMALGKIGGITPLLIRSFTNNMVLDISKIINELGYKPETNLDNSLQELGAWVKRLGGAEILQKAEKQLAWIP